MAKYKIEEEKVAGVTMNYFIKMKSKWWTFWIYARDKNGAIVKYSTKKGAQAYINLNTKKK